MESSNIVSSDKDRMLSAMESSTVESENIGSSAIERRDTESNNVASC